MKSPHKLTTLIASSGFALAISLSAQAPASSPSAKPAPGMKSEASTKTPVPNSPANPNPAPHSPTVSAAPVDPKPGSGLTPGAANSGSGVGGRETVAPVSTPAADAASARNRPSAVNGPGAHGFSTLDADRDGRISLTEFGSPSASWLRAGAPGAGLNNDSVTGRVSTNTPGPRDATGKPVAPVNSGPVAGPNSAAGNAQLFQQLDMNHDGYLSPAEVEAYRAPTPLER
jgi:hypothetical protein